MVALIMRLFSYAFHLVLGLLMAAIGFVALASRQHTLQFGFLPWTGASLTYWLFFLGVTAVGITVLAIRRIVPILFTLWSLAVVVILIRGYFFSSYNFGLSGFTTAVAFTLSSLVALFGAWLVLRQKSTPGKQART